MAEVVMAANPQKRPLGDENAGGANAQDASKKPRGAAPAEAPTAELTEQAKEAAKAFRKHADKHASGWEPQERENAAELVERVAKENKGYNHIAIPVVKAILATLPSNQQPKKLNAAKVRGALTKHLASVSAAAFVVAGAPPKKKEEEGYVEGSVDIRSVKGDGDGEWLRYDNPTKMSKDKGPWGESGPSLQQIQEALRRLSDPKSMYAERRGFEVRHVTDELRCATATNKVVRGWHAPHSTNTCGKNDDVVGEAKKKEEERAEMAADAVADKERREIDCVIRCAEFGLAVVAAPPLPDGATDEDRERLEDEDLDALYGLS